MKTRDRQDIPKDDEMKMAASTGNTAALTGSTFPLCL
jgi:hypothetical protein